MAEQKNPTVISISEELMKALQDSKLELQRCFAQGNLDGVKEKSDKALEVIRQLPEPAATGETIQMHITLSTAFLHTGRIAESLSHAEESVRHAEINIAQRPNQPQPLDILSIALGVRVIALLNSGKTDAAFESAQRSLALAEAIYPKNDFRFHKSLRNLGLVLDRKGDSAEAEKSLLKAYTIICIHAGAQSPEAQMLTDDLVNLCARKPDLDGAEKYARSNYKKILESTLTEQKELLIKADSASRLGSILVKKSQFEEAEGLISDALSIREKAAQSPTGNITINPLGIAYSLAQLSGIQEQLNKLTDKTEENLMRALDIFANVKGQQSPEVINTLGQLRNVRAKRAGGSSTKEDDIDYKVSGENRSNSVSSPGQHTLSLDPFALTEEDRRRFASLPSDDGNSRMMLANAYFEQRKFLAANILLTEAHTLFLKSEGPTAKTTQAAKQNMMVSGFKRIEQLWMLTVREEVLKLEDEVSTSSAGIKL